MLANVNYKAYVDDIIMLVRSFVIKSHYTAYIINKNLMAAGDIVETDLKKWKYYLNLNGQYYTGSTASTSDSLLYINSYDSHSLIEFTKESLINNPITYETYKSDQKLIKNLIDQYPEHEVLIKGIINPIDLDIAINANDHTLLYYNKQYVNYNEINLINKIQLFIDKFIFRWFVSAYVITSPLYYPSFFAILHSSLVIEIINIRLSNCKTNYAHPFHVWCYLGGYFKLNKYKDIIPFEQALFLYKNIEYITKNAGKREILDFLNEGFILPFNLTMYSYILRSNKNGLIEDLNANKLDNIENNVRSNRYLYNTPSSIEDPITYVTINQIVNKIVNEGSLNYLHIEDDINTINSSVRNTYKNELPTGILECTQNRNFNDNKVNVYFERLNYWIYLSSLNYFNVNITLNIPNLISTSTDLTSNEAFLFLVYAANKIANIDLINIPNFQIYNIMKDYISDIGNIKGQMERSVIKGTIKNTSLSWDRYLDMSSDIPNVIQVYNIDDFNKLVNVIINRKIRHILLPSLESKSLGQSEIEYATSAFYINPTCTLTNFTTYDEFFQSIKINKNNLSNDILQYAINSILNFYLELSNNKNSLDSPYKEMVDILKIICSYTVMFISGESKSSLMPMDWYYNFPESINNNANKKWFLEDDSKIIINSCSSNILSGSINDNMNLTNDKNVLNKRHIDSGSKTISISSLQRIVKFNNSGVQFNSILPL